jgi:hypothetical protein
MVEQTWSTTARGAAMTTPGRTDDEAPDGTQTPSTEGKDVPGVELGLDDEAGGTFEPEEDPDPAG